MMQSTKNTEDILKTKILKFGQLASNIAIQGAYLISMQNCGTTFQPLLDQIIIPDQANTMPQLGEYWGKLKTVSSQEIETV